MANPIIPSGNPRGRLLPGALYSSDIDENISLRARRQDEERSIREDDEHFRMTGENRLPRSVDNPLVEDNVPRDVADDGDSYDEPLPYFRRNHTASGEWAEDTPTRIIDQRNVDDLMAAHGIDASREMGIIRETGGNLGAALNDNASRISASRREREAYVRREQEKKDEEQKILEEKNKKKYNNAISGLEADSD